MVDPEGENPLIGMGIGMALEIGSQALRNYRNGCDVFGIENYSLWDIGVAGAVGAVSPGLFFGGKGLIPKGVPLLGNLRGPGGAIRELEVQFARARAPGLRRTLDQRIAAKYDEITEALLAATGFQVIKTGLKMVDDK